MNLAPPFIYALLASAGAMSSGGVESIAVSTYLSYCNAFHIDRDVVCIAVYDRTSQRMLAPPYCCSNCEEYQR